MKITVIGTSYQAFVFGPSLTNIATTSCVWNPEAIQVAAHFVQDFPALSCSQHQTASLEGTNAVNIATKRKKMRSPNNATVIENLKSAAIVDGHSLYDTVSFAQSDFWTFRIGNQTMSAVGDIPLGTAND